jgi:ribosomal protein S18 acetylase RimI-like enzyme
MSRWGELGAFLRTDPRDVGCEEAMAALHVYADMLLSGERPEERFPGVAAHLRACGPCNDDFEGLLDACQSLPPPGPPLQVERHEGDRGGLRASFEEAEDSPTQLDAYINDGVVLVARDGEAVVGHLQLVDGEIKNMAVSAERRGEGIGRTLVAHAADLARSQDHDSITVGTAAADIGNLRFYQRCGFRVRSIERDAFTATTGYPPGLLSDGIPVRDRVWLDLSLG